jgi:hypothetical protein
MFFSQALHAESKCSTDGWPLTSQLEWVLTVLSSRLMAASLARYPLRSTSCLFTIVDDVHLRSSNPLPVCLAADWAGGTDEGDERMKEWMNWRTEGWMGGWESWLVSSRLSSAEQNVAKLPLHPNQRMRHIFVCAVLLVNHGSWLAQVRLPVRRRVGVAKLNATTSFGLRLLTARHVVSQIQRRSQIWTRPDSGQS